MHEYEDQFMETDRLPVEIRRSFRERVFRPAVAIVAAVAAVAIAACSSSHEQTSPRPTEISSVHSEATSEPSQSLEVQKPHEGMAGSSDPQLRILARYETALNHGFGSEMYFTTMPRNPEEADSQADELATTLKEYAHYGIKPLIIMEPTSPDGNIDLTTLHSKEAVSAYQALFTALKNKGITDEEMGTLVPFPEPDLADWGTHTTDPNLFAKNLAAVGNAFKTVFPDGQLSIMLDSTAYPSGDVDYEQGDTSVGALMPYIEAIKRLPNSPKIDSYGHQGFPWSKEDQPADYLNGHTALTLAKALGVKRIWYNTGTAASYKKKQNPNSVRASQLAGVLAQAKIARAAGFNVSVNLFGYKDTDVVWSYPVDGNLLGKFVGNAQKAGVDTELFVD